MSKPIQTFLIILIASIILILAIFFALKLISKVENSNSNPNPQQNLSQTIAISITDGDTFETASGEKIRLLCVDTPEETKEGYEDAKAYLSALVLGKEIIIERQGIDKYNRTLAWIIVNNANGNILVNKEIVDNNFGEPFPYNNTNCSRMI